MAGAATARGGAGPGLLQALIVRIAGQGRVVQRHGVGLTLAALQERAVVLDEQAPGVLDRHQRLVVGLGLVIALGLLVEPRLAQLAEVLHEPVALQLRTHHGAVDVARGGGQPGRQQHGGGTMGEAEGLGLQQDLGVAGLAVEPSARPPGSGRPAGAPARWRPSRAARWPRRAARRRPARPR
jgi:hypothetical protein